MESVIAATVREASGSGEARRLRRAGQLPGVINSENGDSTPVQFDMHGFEMMLRGHRGESLILDVSVDESPARKFLLKEIQHDTLSGHLLHVDMVEISMTRRIHLQIGLQLVGDPPGVVQGGVLEHVLREIEVECLPTDLVEAFEVDVSTMEIGDTILIRDLTIDPKYTLMAADDLAIVHVAAPRVEEEVAEEEGEEGEAAEEGAEPEVIGKGEDEGAEAEGDDEKKKEKKE